LSRAESQDAIRISPVTLFEVIALHTIGRLQLTRPPEVWIRQAMESAPLRIAELSPTIAMDAGRIPRDLLADPMDRLLVATAREMEATLLTADTRILNYAARARTVRTQHAGR
jgi:PIN domain nuclease of toxin-antitoxin system